MYISDAILYCNSDIAVGCNNNITSAERSGHINMGTELLRYAHSEVAINDFKSKHANKGQLFSLRPLTAISRQREGDVDRRHVLQMAKAKCDQGNDFYDRRKLFQALEGFLRLRKGSDNQKRGISCL